MFQKIKRQDGFLFTFVSFYKFLGSSIFSFVFFLCCNKVYIYIYIYIYIYTQRRLFTLHVTSQNKPSAHTRSLTGAWKFFLGLIF